ncbi:unknown [Clostridium sp. CAG:354]|nr:unknown [Clostridium sp. CAG:354]
MKILFAVNNEKISKSIIKKYQSDYKEIISYKNVYYFNAILKELQKDNTYDRIIISEDLEPFTNNNYEQIDKFIFERLDNISDEATNSTRADTPIILICSDRRTKSDEILVKLFSIGIYNALIGTDRNIDEICKLIKVPRTKKEAKIYYKIDAEEVTYQSENENDVSESEIQSILAHYKKIGRDEQKCVDSFDSIAQQYTDVQLKVIASFLPLNVKAILEEKSPKYQQIMSLMGEKRSSTGTAKTKDIEDNGLKIGFIESSNGKRNLGRPVIIPSAVNTNKVKKMSAKTTASSGLNIPEPIEPIIDGIDDEDTSSVPEPVEEVKTKRRGRPPKKKTEEEVVKAEESKPKRRGRPPKKKQEEITMPGFDDDDDEPQVNTMPGFDDDDEPQVNTMPGFDDDDEPQVNTVPGFDDDDESQANTIPGFDDDDNDPQIDNSSDFSSTTQSNGYIPFDLNSPTGRSNDYNQTKLTNTRRTYPTDAIDALLTREKKIVTFVGTSKNGTSFLVNNLALSLSKKGIDVAILDATRNRNAYYIYTENEEDLRQIAEKSIPNLINGVAAGLKVDKNLTVYTALPDDDVPMEQYEEILSTLVKNHSLILIDCDFETDFGYFAASQEIYLVQSMDIITIQPLTAFLRDLQSKNIYQPENLRIVINKELPVKTLTVKNIIGGLSFYNDPSMSFMRELFNRETAKYCTIPFEIATYSKYLEGLVNCKISLNGYSKEFMQALRTLENMVYPLMEPTPASNRGAKSNNNYERTRFSNEMNDTLNQMKKNF